MSLATPPTIRRLQEALDTKAKQEPAYRVYLLYDMVSRSDLLLCARQATWRRSGRGWGDVRGHRDGRAGAVAGRRAGRAVNGGVSSPARATGDHPRVMACQELAPGFGAWL